MTTVLVVDDSALMRKYLKRILEDGGFAVVTARNGEDALAQVHAVGPDVVTLDINMPEMDGLTCLSRIMAESPRPVVMVSSLTDKGPSPPSRPWSSGPWTTSPSRAGPSRSASTW